MSIQTTNQTTIALLTEYLPRYGWPGYTVVEDTPEQGKILTGWHSPLVNETRMMFVALDHHQEALVLAVPALVVAPQESMPIGQLADVLMAIGFANYGLTLGNFAYDPADGEIRFQVGMPIDGAAITYEQFAHLLNVAQASVGYWGSRINDVAQGARTGEAVVQSFRGHLAEFVGVQQ